MNYHALALLGVLALGISEPALAHSPISGFNSFYSGVLHPLVVPAHLLVLLALGLFIGQNGAQKYRIAFLTTLAMTFAGLALSTSSMNGLTDSSEVEPYLLAVCALVALLVCSKLSLGRSLMTGLAALAGLVIGLDSSQELVTGKERLYALIGTGIGITLLLLYAVGFASLSNKKYWQKIMVRVVGSWIAASALLILSLSFASTK